MVEDLFSNVFRFFPFLEWYFCFSPWEPLVWLTIMTIQRQLNVASQWHQSSLSTFELIYELLICSLAQPIFIKSVFLAPNLSALSGLGFLIADFIGKDWDKEGIKYLNPSLCQLSPVLHSALGSHFPSNFLILVEYFPVILHILCQIQLQMSSSFSKSIPAQLYSSTILFLDHLTLLSPLSHFCSMLESSCMKKTEMRGQWTWLLAIEFVD